jgi:hypothetical protein
LSDDNETTKEVVGGDDEVGAEVEEEDETCEVIRGLPEAGCVGAGLEATGD